MPADHMDLPAQAVACLISGLEPADATCGWNPNDGQMLADVATNKVLHAVVKVLPQFCYKFVNLGCHFSGIPLPLFWNSQQ